MEGFMYPATLIFLISVAMMFYRQNSPLLMFLALGVAVYIVYAQESENRIAHLENGIFKSTNSQTQNSSRQYQDDF